MDFQTAPFFPALAGFGLPGSVLPEPHLPGLLQARFQVRLHGLVHKYGFASSTARVRRRRARFGTWLWQFATSR